MIDGTVRQAPIATIHIKSPYYSGVLEALCVDRSLCDVIVGNVAGAIGERVSVTTQTDEIIEAAAVVTRAQEARMDTRGRDIKVLDPVNAAITRSDLVQQQQADETLVRAIKQAERGHIVEYDSGNQARYEIVNNLLRRTYTNQLGRTIKQIVVPKGMRNKVLSLAHDPMFAGHLGIKKTSDRILASFFWPGITGDVTRYCRSCGVCQRTIPKGRVPKAPLQRMPIIDIPFQRVAMDIIGPIDPMSTSRNRFILTVVDYATRYPEAVALPSVDTKQVAEGVAQDIL